MESQIELLKEQINTAHASDAHLKSRITLIDEEQKEKTAQQDRAQARQLSEQRAQVKEAAGKEKQAVEAAQQRAGARSLRWSRRWQTEKAGSLKS